MIMTKDSFLQKQRLGILPCFSEGLSYEPTEKSTDKFLFLLKKVGAPWHWDHIAKYKDRDYITKKMKNEDTNLFYIYDDIKTVGYVLTTLPDRDELEKIGFDGAAKQSIMEIENIGMFPHHAGKKRGLKLFSMIMNDLFKTHDAVYLSMSSTNHPRLYDFYTKKLGMAHIGTSYAPDPRLEKTESTQIAA